MILGNLYNLLFPQRKIGVQKSKQEKYSLQWWQEKYFFQTPIQQVACYLTLATKQGICKKETNLFIPMENKEKVLDFISKRLDKQN